MAITLDGTSGATLPSGIGPLIGNGLLLNIQYFTTTTTPYTPTTGTNFVIVEVVGGGGGSGTFGNQGGSGGTTSFGALVSATGGVGGGQVATGGNGGSGLAGGDLNINGGFGSVTSGTTPYYSMGGSSFYSPINFSSSSSGISGLSYGGGARGSSTFTGGGGGGGYSLKRITSAFSGVTITVGAGGTSSGNVGASGIVIVYEYA